VIGLTALSSVGHRTLAQDRTPPPQFRAGVEVVLLDVAVLDRNRVPVRNLQTSDFTVLENGSSRRIVSFQEVSVPEPDGALVSWMREVAPDVRTNAGDDRRVVVIVLDDATVSFRSVAGEAESFAWWIVSAPDAASTVYRLAEVSQDFTSDRARLRVPSINSSTPIAGCAKIFDRHASPLLNICSTPRHRKAVIFVSSVQLDLGGAAAQESEPARRGGRRGHGTGSRTTWRSWKRRSARRGIYPISTTAEVAG
jgi:hypothetical protein